MTEADCDDYFDDEEGPPCPKCNGLKTVACYCGGDFCICQNDGERDCPLCFGEGIATPERAEKYLQREREMAEFMRKWHAEDRARASADKSSAGGESS